MILKYLENGSVQTMQGSLTDFHESKGFIEVADDFLELKEDGTRYNFYKDDGKPDLVAEQEAIDNQVKAEADIQKAKDIESMTVTIGSGKVFYADAASRVDMASAIDGAKLKEELGTPVTAVLWKLAEEFEGSKLVKVTLLEIREASALALERKAEIVGAIAKESI